MRRSVSGLMVLLLVGAAALLAVLLAAPTAVRAAEADTAAVTVAEGVAEDAALEAAEAELDDEEEIGAEEEADDENESDDEADDEAEEEDASFVEVDSPAAAESTEVPQTPGVVVQPKPVDPAPPAKQQKKAKKVRLPMEAAYYGEKLPTKPKQFSLPEYGDPNPKRTAAKAKKALKSGKPAHPRVFTANYLSPVPQSHPRVKCYGKGKKEKCFRVTRSGQVVGRHVHRGLPRVVAETRSLHAMEKKGFQTAEYDDKLAKWKPRRHKRTLSPAVVMSLLQVDATGEDHSTDPPLIEPSEESVEADVVPVLVEADSEGEDEAESETEDDSEAEAEAEDEGEAEAESESEADAEFVPANLVRKGCPKAQKCPACRQPKAVSGKRRTKKHANTFARMHSSDDAEADMTVRDRLRPAFMAGVQFADDAVTYQLKVDKLKRKSTIALMDAVRQHKTIPKGCPLLPKKLQCQCRPPIAIAPLPETYRAAMGYALKLGDADMSYRWSMREASRDAFLAGVKYADTERAARQATNKVVPAADVPSEADDNTVATSSKSAIEKLQAMSQAVKDRDDTAHELSL